mmetsp:Transcript_27808/g.74909  ORF Transcript_27808/g.74909 Transcript_27808/m.74909 type:complete len:172 (+) Transcript_27808:3-518(+)
MTLMGDAEEDEEIVAIREEEQFNDMLETMLNLSAELDDVDGDEGYWGEGAAASGDGGVFGRGGVPRATATEAAGAAQPSAPGSGLAQPEDQPLETRIEELREELKALLGEDRFEAAHARLMAVAEEDDDEQLARDVNQILGANHMDRLRELLNLIDWEEQLLERGECRRLQ